MNAPEKSKSKSTLKTGADSVNVMTGSGPNPEPVHVDDFTKDSDLHDQLDAAFASSEADWWHEPIYLVD